MRATCVSRLCRESTRESQFKNLFERCSAGALDQMRATRRVQRLLEELGASPSTRRPGAHESFSSQDNDGTTPERTRGSSESPVRTLGRGRGRLTAYARRLNASAMRSDRAP